MHYEFSYKIKERNFAEQNKGQKDLMYPRLKINKRDIAFRFLRLI